MSNFVKRTAVASSVFALLVAVTASGVRASQSGDPQGVPQLLAVIVSALGDLQDALAGLQDSVDGLGEPALAKDRYTPIGSARPGFFEFCSVANVSNATRQLHVELRDETGAIVEEGDHSIGPGEVFNQAAARLHPSNSNQSVEYFYCAFTVVDGVKTDIRASLRVENGFGEALFAMPAE